MITPYSTKTQFVSIVQSGQRWNWTRQDGPNRRISKQSFADAMSALRSAAVVAASHDAVLVIPPEVAAWEVVV